MAAYLTETDIANRALQHLGASRIASFAEISKNASEMSFAYDKVRRAELSRNTWRFALKSAVLRPLATTTMMFTPPDYSATVYYQPGNVVTYANAMWVTVTPFNYGVAPGTGDTWQPYFGPLSMSYYDSTVTYRTGELVYTAPTFPGLVASYMSLDDANTEVPSATPAYDATVTYGRGDLVTYSASTYISLIDLNVANTPASTYALWLAATTYAMGNTVILPDGRIFTSVGNGNIGHDPALDTAGTYWTFASSVPYFQPWLTFAGGVHSLKWRYLDIIGTANTTVKPRIIYPLGSGPITGDSGRSIYRLPAGYLKMTPQDPKAGSVTFNGAPTGMDYLDWDLQGNYMTTRMSEPIPMRFVGDIRSVPDMHDMFCEGLAARLAMELCETLTQSSEKVRVAAAAYKWAMSEARMVNAIDIGSVELPEDDYLTTRR